MCFLQYLLIYTKLELQLFLQVFRQRQLIILALHIYVHIPIASWLCLPGCVESGTFEIETRYTFICCQSLDYNVWFGHNRNIISTCAVVHTDQPVQGLYTRQYKRTNFGPDSGWFWLNIWGNWKAGFFLIFSQDFQATWAITPYKLCLSLICCFHMLLSQLRRN